MKIKSSGKNSAKFEPVIAIIVIGCILGVTLFDGGVIEVIGSIIVVGFVWFIVKYRNEFILKLSKLLHVHKKRRNRRR